MRGKDAARKQAVQACGITPAYAGKRRDTGEPRVLWWDHPRLCGEKSSSTDCQKGLLGSPPPMRGKDANFIA